MGLLPEEDYEVPGGYTDSLSSNTQLGRAVNDACLELDALGKLVSPKRRVSYPLNSAKVGLRPCSEYMSPALSTDCLLPFAAGTRQQFEWLSRGGAAGKGKSGTGQQASATTWIQRKYT